MSTQELDFELVEESTDGGTDTTIETNETTTVSDDKSGTGSEENTSSAKSKKSNFKKISKLNKALISDNKKRDAELKKLKAKLSNDSSDDFDDLDDDYDDEPVIDKNELRFFFIENPGAKELKDSIEELLEETPWLSLERAFVLAKAIAPTESQTTTDFETKSSNTKVRKKLSDLSAEEALKLDGSKYLEWARLKWQVK